MNTQVPAYLYPFILASTVATVAAVLIGLNRSLKLARWPEPERRSAFQTIATLLLAWGGVAIVTSWLGLYQGGSNRVPTLQFGLVIPIVLGVLLYLGWGTLRRVVDAVPQSWMVGVQFYRALGVIFLILLAQGRLPGAFAWPAGTGDVFVGLAAPLVALAYSQSRPNASRWVRAWNWLGLTDLVVAVTTGFLSSPSPLQKLAFDSPNLLISAFPLVLVPVFLVPLSILLHLASLRKLWRAEAGRVAPRAVLA